MYPADPTLDLFTPTAVNSGWSLKSEIITMASVTFSESMSIASGKFWNVGKFSNPTKFPKFYKGFDKDRAKLRGYLDKMTRSRGGEMLRAGIMIRAEEGPIRQAMSALTGAMESASAYSAYEAEEGSAMFLLEARVRRLLPFWNFESLSGMWF